MNLTQWRRPFKSNENIYNNPSIFSRSKLLKIQKFSFAYVERTFIFKEIKNLDPKKAGTLIDNPVKIVNRNNK